MDNIASFTFTTHQQLPFPRPISDTEGTTLPHPILAVCRLYPLEHCGQCNAFENTVISHTQIHNE